MIHDVKDDPILQDSSQEPSMSSKYDFQDVGFLTHFSSCKKSENWHISEEPHIMIIYGVKDDPILPDSREEPSTSSKIDFEDGFFLTDFESC